MHVGQGWICWQQSNVYGCLSKHGAGTINTHYLQSCTRVHCICRLTTDEPGSGERPASKCLTALVSMLLPCRNALWTNWSQSILVSWKPVVVAHPPSILLHCVMACVRSVSVQIIPRHRERYVDISDTSVHVYAISDCQQITAFNSPARSQMLVR